MRALSTFEAWGTDARDAALHYVEPSLAEIESVLCRPSPDAELRGDLALMLWDYALDVAGKTGGDPIRPAETNRYLTRLKKQVRQLRATLTEPQAVDAILMVGLDVLPLVDQLDDTLFSFENVKVGIDKGGRVKDVRHYALMHDVAVLYQKATGESPTLTTDSVTGKFGGDFFRVAELIDAAASAATGLQAKTNGALGERLAVIIKKGGEPR